MVFIRTEVDHKRKPVIIKLFGLCILMVLILTSCSKPVPIEVQIQEQLDLGNKYLTEMNYEQAVIAFTKAIELDEKNIEAYEGLGSVYMAQENYEQGIDIYNKLIELDGGSWSAYEGAARAYEALGRRDEAIAVAERGLKASDVSEEGKSYVIGLYRQMIEEAENDGDYAKAIEYCNRILEIDPQNTEAVKMKQSQFRMQKETQLESLLSQESPDIEAINELMDGEGSLLFKDNFITPEEIHINGKPFYQASKEDVMAMHPTELPLTVCFSNPPENEWYAFHVRPGTDDFEFTNIEYSHGENQFLNYYIDLGYYHSWDEREGEPDWSKLPVIDQPDARGIMLRDSFDSVMEKIGFSENAIKLINKQPVSLVISPQNCTLQEFDISFWKSGNIHQYPLAKGVEINWDNRRIRFVFSEDELQHVGYEWK